MRRFILFTAVFAAIVLACPVAADVPPGKTILIDHHTATLKEPLCGRAGCDFRYLPTPHLTPVCGHAGPVCDCFAQDGYDGSDWSVGTTPFLDLAAVDVNCPLYDRDGGSVWPVSGDVVIRAEFELCEGVTGLEVHIAVDNSVAVWLNGRRLDDPANCMPVSHSPEGFCDTEGCAAYDRLKFIVPDDLLRFSPGEPKNVLAFQVCDHGVGSFFDFDVVADVSREVPCLACDFATVNPTLLWPPDHRLKEVAVTVGQGTAAVPGLITSVFQDEPVKANWGDRCPDAVIADDGLSVRLRSERLGPPYSPGRIYHVNFEAEVGGQTCVGTAKVCVPHDSPNDLDEIGIGPQRACPVPDCVDSGPIFLSTICP